MNATGATGPAGPAADTHPCVRCGRPVPLDIALCEFCNPLGLAQPAPAQAHGTVAVAIIGAVVVLAVLAGLARSGVGPFQSAVTDVAQAPPSLVLTISVTNRGATTGIAHCRISDDQGRAATITTEPLEPGSTAVFTRVVTDLGQTAGEPGSYAVACRA